MRNINKATLEECNKRDYGCGLCPHVGKLCPACYWEETGKIQQEKEKIETK